MYKSNKDQSSKALMKLIKIKSDLDNLLINCSSQDVPDRMVSLLLQVINQLEAQIDHYFEKNAEKAQIEIIRLEPLTLPKSSKLLDNLHSANINYKLVNGKIYINHFESINRAILSLKNLKLITINDVRIYLNRLIRLKNLLIKGKYNISLDFYNLPTYTTQQLGGGDGSTLSSTHLNTVKNNLNQFKTTVDSLIQQQDIVIALFKDLMNDLAPKAPQISKTDEECDILYRQTLSQYEDLSYLKNLLDRLLHLLETKNQVPDKELIEAIQSVKKIELGKPPNPKPCDALAEYAPKINKNYQQTKKYEDSLIDYYENIQASTRVYLRLNQLKKLSKSPVAQIDARRVKYDNVEYGPFYSIYTPTMSNDNLYYPTENLEIKPLKGIFDQLKRGYSNFIFGYGYSGSGKTYTLFGDGKTSGILQLGLADMSNESNLIIKYKYIFEIYGNILPEQTQTAYDGQIYVYYDGHERQLQKDIEVDPSLFSYDYHLNSISDSTDVIGTINSLLDEINGIRIKNGHIKKTINNPQSSRGHLFLIFEIIDKNTQISSYLTVVDMAGIENPIEIKNTYFNASNSEIFTAIGDPSKRKVTGVPGKLKLDVLATEYNKKKIDTSEIPSQLARIYSILAEGLYINETINHLKYWLVKRQEGTLPIIYQGHYGKVQKKMNENCLCPTSTKTHLPLSINCDVEINQRKMATDEYCPAHFFIDPKGPNYHKILILPILQYLEQLAIKTPSKYIMLSLLRVDRQIFVKETLDYAQSLIVIPSTKE